MNHMISDFVETPTNPLSISKQKLGDKLESIRAERDALKRQEARLADLEESKDLRKKGVEQMEKDISRLNEELAKNTPGTPKYIKLRAEEQQLNEQLKAMQEPSRA